LDVIKDLLVKKFEEIENRIQLVLNQLSDEQINWRPNESSNSIANLVIHIRGNMLERISQGINGKAFERERDEEFEEMYKSKLELLEMMKESFHECIETIRNISDNKFMQTQQVRGKERTNLEMLFQCATHFSEHMGQMFFIGKMLKDEEYITTSIPKKTKK